MLANSHYRNVSKQTSRVSSILVCILPFSHSSPSYLRTAISNYEVSLDSFARTSSSAGVKHRIPIRLTRYLNLSSVEAIILKLCPHPHDLGQLADNATYSASADDIAMFVVCACARFQVTHKVSHLHAVKRIFRYLKGQPKLGLWYPKDSPIDLEAYTDSDYADASLYKKSTIGGVMDPKSNAGL
nr:uncharacterized mitochondrial protein AtMg00810-like [Tanacetum cinerariifolium]